MALYKFTYLLTYLFYFYPYMLTKRVKEQILLTAQASKHKRTRRAAAT